MPLRDHFRPPFSNCTSWEGFHGGWPMVIVQQLGRLLPDRYVGEPRDADAYEVCVYDTERGRRLVAVVEIISPANKYRPESRSQFVAKCAALLRQQVSVILVDLVTNRDFNLYADFLELIDEKDPTIGDSPTSTYAVACRWHPRGVTHWLEAWSRPLVIGKPLPVLPLWLSNELAIPAT